MNPGIIADSNRIVQLIPQRKPFVMVDCLYRCEEKFIQTGFTPLSSTVFVQGEIFTEPGLIENMAQSAAAGTGYFYTSQGKAVPVGYIGAIKNFRLFEVARINQLLITDVEIIAEVMNASVVKAEIRRGEDIVASCEMKIFLTIIPDPV